MWSKILTVIGAVVLMGSIWMAAEYVNSTYARAADVQTNRLDIQINQVRGDLRWLDLQIRSLLNGCGATDPSQLTGFQRDSYLEYQTRRNELWEKQKMLENKRLNMGR